MGSTAERLLQEWKSRHRLSVPIRNSTVTCGLNTTLVSEIIVPKPCCSRHTKLQDVITHTTEWLSGLKTRASMFKLWYIYDLLEQNKEIPPIDTKLVTIMFAAVQGKKTKLNTEYQKYKKIMNIQQDYPSVAHSSQILEHAKNEIKTVDINCINTNFDKRMRTCIRWQIHDSLQTDEMFLNMKKRNEYVAKLLDKKILPFIKDETDTELSFNEEFSVFSDSALTIITELANFHKTLLFESLEDASAKIQNRKTEKVQTAIKRGKKFENLTLKRKTKKISILKQVQTHTPHLLLKYLYTISNIIQQLPLTTEYNKIKTEAFEHEDKDERKKIWKKWKWGYNVSVPAFKLLPIFHTKTHFIRIDKSQLEGWGLIVPSDNDDTWWFSNVFDLYNKQANLRQLQRYKDFSSPKTTRLIMDDDNINDVNGPYIVGGSIQTDGLQIKVPILSLRHSTPNLHKLFDRGYSGIPNKEKHTVDISKQQKGVFKLSTCVLSENNKDFTAVDPGGNKPICHTSATVTDICNNRENTCKYLSDKEKFITNDEYHEAIGSKNFQRFEKNRRTLNPQYQESIVNMRKVSNKTTDIVKLNDYIKKRLEYEEMREAELINSTRRGYHFYVFRRQQKAIANIVKNVLGDKQNQVILFGNGTFSPGGHGYACVPKKKFIRQFAQHSVVVLVDEYCTSKLCPLCFSELKTSDQKERIRMCTTVTENSTCFEADRDSIGAINILQKGVYRLLNNPLPAFERV